MEPSDGTTHEALLNALLNVAREECLRGRWEQIEPRLAECWRQLRHPSDPHWSEVARRVQQACHEAGLLEEG